MRCIWSWWWNKSSGIGESTARKIAAMTAGVSFSGVMYRMMS